MDGGHYPSLSRPLRLWCSGVLVAIVVPVSWAVIFSVAGLVTSDALAWSAGLGSGLEAIVKPFVAVACFYLAYRAPAFLLAQARMIGVRLPNVRSLGHAPGEQRVRSTVRSGARSKRERFAGVGLVAARPMTAGAAMVGAAVARQTAGVRHAARQRTAGALVNTAAAIGGSERTGRVVERVAERLAHSAQPETSLTSGAQSEPAAEPRATPRLRVAGDWWRVTKSEVRTGNAPRPAGPVGSERPTGAEPARTGVRRSRQPGARTAGASGLAERQRATSSAPNGPPPARHPASSATGRRFIVVRKSPVPSRTNPRPAGPSRQPPP